MRHTMLVGFALLFLFLGLPMQAIGGNVERYDNYISTYALLAQQHQLKYNIPASITLAQAILESNAGESDLAVKANNHFGIEAHYWDGPTMRKGDRIYRKYESVEESYEDHSKFLQSRRYGELYDLKLTDYKGWARGLQRCGYAEDKGYADKLIRVVEDNGLAEYTKHAERAVLAMNGGDMPRPEADNTVAEVIDETLQAEIEAGYEVYNKWGLDYVLAHEGDTYYTIGAVMGIKPAKLAKYNDDDKRAVLREGEVVYIEKKHRKAEAGVETHIVAEGESLRTISQQYGVEMRRLARRNKMRFDAVVTVGQELQLR